MQVTCEIKSSLVAAKASFNKKAVCTKKIRLKFQEESCECYIWSVAYYGAENWTLRKVYRKDL